MVGGPRDDILINIRVLIEQAKKNLKEVKKKTGKTAKDVEGHMREVATAQNDVWKQQQRLAKEMGRGKSDFQGWALSIMFFGMALKNTFNNIWRSSSKTFTDVIQSVDGAVSGFTRLDGSLKFLQFTAGAALEPIAEFLIPIIDWLARLISENEKWAAVIITVTGVLGFLFTVIGAGTLAVYGMIEAWTKIGGLFGALSKIPWASIGNKIKNLGATIATNLIDAMKWISANPIKSLMGGLVAAGIILVIAWLMKLSEEMGGFDELALNVARGFMKAQAIMFAGIEALIMKIQAMWAAWRGGDARTGSFKDFYGEALQRHLDTIEEKLGKPIKGYVDESRSLRQILSADLYDDLEASGLKTGDILTEPSQPAEITEQSASAVSDVLNIHVNIDGEEIFTKTIDKMESNS